MELNRECDMYFGTIKDNRCEANVKHKLVDILKLFLLASLCGLDEIEKIVKYGKSKKDFLEREFNIKSIPSESTLTRVISSIDSKMLSMCMVGILKSIIKGNVKHIMLDGKAIKATDAMKTIEKMMNIVTAYTDTGISLMQETVDEKTNEIPIVRDLLDCLDVKGKIVTADALHCQKETAEKIIDKKGDYILQVKKNQGKLHEDIYNLFDEKYANTNNRKIKDEYEISDTLEKSHGRIEKRICYVVKDVEYFSEYFKEWKGLKKIFAIERIIERDEKETREISCYISSADMSAEKLMKYVREHWEIESMHHILDVSYNEDKCLLYTQKAQENLNIFRKFGVSIYKNYLKSKKQTIRSKMFDCLLNDNVLLEILQSCNK